MDTDMLTAHVPITQLRRAKQLVPDVQKDNNYWQKRQRNNMAAKKSRENKRQHECMVRARAVALEEENCLLKRELELLKERFGIPKDACILTSEERDECIHQCKRKLSFQESSNKYQSSSSMDTSGDSDYTGHSINVDSQRESSPDPIYTPMSDEVVWAITPAHSHSLKRYAESSELYRNEVNSQGREKQFLESKRKRTYLEDDMIPADLSFKRKFSKENSSCTNETCIQEVTGSHTDYSLMDHRSSSEMSNDPIDLTNDRSDNEMLNSDIKCKLQILSDQVERMQKIVCNSNV